MKCLKYISLLLAGLFLAGNLPAQNYPEKPNPPRLVNDFAGMLSASERAALESKLVQYYDSTSNQVAIVIVKDLDGYVPSDYAFGLGEKWGIGMKGRDNGILILVKPKTAESKGEVFIATGYGAEGAVPDAACKIITDNEIIPRFKEGKYYEGLDAATRVIFQLMKGEYSWADYKGKKPANHGQGDPTAGIFGVLLFIFIIFMFVFRAVRGAKRAHTLSGSSIPWWIWAGMMSSGGSHKSNSNWGSFNSGSGIFGGGGGGGGFGGFGGGSFGGGGAGGSW